MSDYHFRDVALAAPVSVGGAGGPLTDLFTNPGLSFEFPSNAALFSVPFFVDGTPPAGSTRTLQITVTQTSGGSPVVTTMTFVFDPEEAAGIPVANAWPFIPFAFGSGSVIAVTAAFDFLGQAEDFLVPSGPQAGQYLDGYTYSFTISKTGAPL